MGGAVRSGSDCDKFMRRWLFTGEICWPKIRVRRVRGPI